MSSSVSASPTPTPTPVSSKSSSTSLVPSSASGKTNAAPKATLTATITSAFDLIRREPPIGIQIAVGARTATTDGPVQRHKNHNSFKFAASESISLTAASLRDFYNQELIVKVLYQDDNAEPNLLQATVCIREQLIINQPTWMILSLTGSGTGAKASATMAVQAAATTATEKEDESSTAPEKTATRTLPLALPPPPTLRLQLTLTGPYRPEIALVIRAAQQWCRVVDHLELQTKQARERIMGQAQAVSDNIHQRNAQQLVLMSLAAIPVVLTLLVAFGVPALLLSIPLAIPMMVIGMAVCAVAILLIAVLYASSSSGRHSLHKACEYLQLTRLWTQLVQSPTGQGILYDVGSRPSPVQVTRDVLVPTNMWSKLAMSLAVDAMGNASYLLPLAGEAADFAWAPLQTILVMAMYEMSSPKLKYVSFMEEILPFTDILPSATIGWMLEYYGVPGLVEAAHPRATQSQASSVQNAAKAAGEKVDPSSSLMMMHPPVTERIQ